MITIGLGIPSVLKLNRNYELGRLLPSLALRSLTDEGAPTNIVSVEPIYDLARHYSGPVSSLVITVQLRSDSRLYFNPYSVLQITRVRCCLLVDNCSLPLGSEVE
jgi:hypothetical protein